MNQPDSTPIDAIGAVLAQENDVTTTPATASSEHINAAHSVLKNIGPEEDEVAAVIESVYATGVWILIIGHRYGVDSYALISPEAAQAKLFAFVLSYWDELPEHVGDIEDYDNAEAIETYFEYHNEDSYVIDRAIVGK